MISKLKELTDLLNSTASDTKSKAWTDLGKLKKHEIDLIYEKKRVGFNRILSRYYGR